MKGTAYSTLAVPTAAVSILLTLHSIFLVHLGELCKLCSPRLQTSCPLLMSTTLMLRPRAVLVSTYIPRVYFCS